MPRKENLHKLSNEMGVEFDGDDVVLYDTRAYSAKRITVITEKEMLVLTALFTDAWCPSVWPMRRANPGAGTGAQEHKEEIRMSYHYHVIECPHCGTRQQRGCSLDNCTTATVSLEPFTSSDGYEAERAWCPDSEAYYYVDFGIRELEVEQ